MTALKARDKVFASGTRHLTSRPRPELPPRAARSKSGGAIVTSDDLRDLGLPPLKPFLKWVGGKAKLTAEIREALGPRQNDGRYFEPFLGGGAVLFSLLKDEIYPAKACVVGDTNERLIATYRQVQNDVEGVLSHLTRLVEALPPDWSSDQAAREAYYNKVRDMDLSGAYSSQIAAWVLFINKTCFNGLWRVNKAGRYNVPVGKNAYEPKFDKYLLRLAGEVLTGAQIACASYEDVIEGARKGDVVYLDPPYAPMPSVEATQKSFTSYNEEAFGYLAHVKLAEHAARLVKSGVRVVVSNSDCPFVREIYGDKSLFSVKSLSSYRSVSAAGGKRLRAREVLITPGSSWNGSS